MKKCFIVICLFFAFIPTAFSSPTHLTAKELLAYCEVAMDVFDKNFGRIQTEREFLQGTKAGICQGYIMGMNDAGKRPCLPANFIMLENVAAVVKYLKTHPQELGLPASVAVKRSFEHYFNCK